MELRRHLMMAALAQPFAFGGAGFYLFKDDDLSERGKGFLEEIRKSENYAAHLKEQAPRLAGSANERFYLFEVTVRFFCNLQISKDEETLYPEETRKHLLILREITDWLDEHRDQPEFLKKYGHVLDDHARISQKFMALLNQEELLSLAKKSVMHRYPSTILFDDLKRFLREVPLGSLPR